MREVKFRAGFQHLLDAFVLHFGVSVDDVGKKVFVLVVKEISHSDNGGHIADLAHDASEMKSDRSVCAARLVEVREKLGVDALGEKPHLRTVVFLEDLARFEEIVVFRRDRRYAGLYPFDDAFVVLHAL